MKHLAVPTTRVPDGRLVIERKFASELVDAVNYLIDEVRDIRKAMAGEEASRKGADAGLSSRIDDLGGALTKASAAIEVLLGGTDL